VNAVSYGRGRTRSEGVPENGAEEVIWALGELTYRRQKKTA